MGLVDRVKERARELARWLVARPPFTIVLAGWVGFFLGSYPGYMSFESAMQLFDVRNGVYRDTYPPLMTGVWSLLEIVFSGPFLMLALQSGLFLFGLAAVLRTMLVPRVAALTAVAVLLFPPVFAPMAVIWRESLLAGALLGAIACFVQPPAWKWRIAGGVLLVLACSCRPEVVVGIVPLVLLAMPKLVWWRRAGLALAATVAIAGVARLADYALTDVETHERQQALQVADIFGTLRRARVTDEGKVQKLLDGVPLTTPEALRAALAGRAAVLDWWTFSHGEKASLGVVADEEQAAALDAAWSRVIAAYPSGYLRHRWLMTKHMLGVIGKQAPVHDSFGDPDLIAGLHHRATTSDWQVGTQAFVRLVAKTPLFKPWLYVLLAIVALVLARGRSLLRVLVASGMLFELAMIVRAATPDYRFSHWLITVTTVALTVLAVSRRAAWRQ